MVSALISTWGQWKSEEYRDQAKNASLLEAADDKAEEMARQEQEYIDEKTAHFNNISIAPNMHSLKILSDMAHRKFTARGDTKAIQHLHTVVENRKKEFKPKSKENKNGTS